MSKTITVAKASDFEAVRDITQTTIREVYPKYYPAGAVDFFSAHHSDERIASDIEKGIVYLLCDDGETVGTVTIDENHINRLFVLPTCQKKGYGRFLMDFAEEKIFRDHDSIELDASFSAKNIYLRRGYVETEYHTLDTGKGDYLCYDVMVKSK